MNNDQKKKVLSLIALALLVFSSLTKFLQYEDYREVYLYTRHIKGFFILVLLVTGIAVSSISKKKKAYYFLSGFSIAAFLYITVSVLRYKLATSTLQIGFYFYLFCLTHIFLKKTSLI